MSHLERAHLPNLAGELLGALALSLHAAGVDLPGLLAAAQGHAPAIAIGYLALSGGGAAYGYYSHCSAIERWVAAQPAGTEGTWRCQPGARLDPASAALAVRLGTFNAGCAAVYGGLTTLLHLRGGWGAPTADRTRDSPEPHRLAAAFAVC